MLMPLIPELPEDLTAVTLDPDTDPSVNGDVVDAGEDSGGEETQLLLESQAKIAGETKVLVMRSHLIHFVICS